MTISLIEAGDAGRAFAANTLAGVCSASEAGDAWVAFADRSHELGVAFLSAFDAAGGVR